MFRRPLPSSTRRALSRAASTTAGGFFVSGDRGSSSTAVTLVASPTAVTPALFAPSRPLLVPSRRPGAAATPRAAAQVARASTHRGGERDGDEDDDAVVGVGHHHRRDGTIASSSAGARVTEAELSPYDIKIESVLLPSSSSPAGSSLKSLVSLLLDPNAAGVESVALSDFAAMVPRRQLKALGDNKEWLDFILGSEQYQATKDARTLRLAGVTSLGRWDEVPDRVPISAYSRGLLDQAFQQLVRTRGQTQKEEVLTWLTRAIQRAVADEFASAAAGGGKTTTPMLPLVATEALPEGAATTSDKPSTPKQQQHQQSVAKEEDDDVVEDVEEVLEEVIEEEEEAPLHQQQQSGGTAHTDEADFALMMAELEAAEADLKREEAGAPKQLNAKASSTAKAAASPATKEAAWFDRSSPRSSKKASAAVVVPAEVADEPSAVPPAENEPEEEVEEVVEEIVEEVEEEVVEEEEFDEEKEDAAAVADIGAAEAVEAAAATPPATADTAAAAAVDPKLSRLAQLMLTQFNSADGYLHSAGKKEFKADEKAGFISVIDDGTAQVDPLALFSAFHNAKILAEAPVEVRALKQVWNGFNAHQMLMEDASDSTDEAFHRQKSVDALVHGALLMRAISREEDVMLDHSSLLPKYGFPLLSSDLRSYASEKPKDSPHTDISFMTIEVAVKAFKGFFANKEVCSTPFRPRVDVNGGCGVVMLSGTTLHLYETSLKSSIQEDQVRANFAEAMLGVLHVCKNKILPRVNTVHYHIMVTSLPGSGRGDGDDDEAMLTVQDEITSPTTIVSIDMTGPFTVAEKARLRAMSEPLGFSADEMREFNCIEDIVMEIDDATGVTIVHDLLQNRDDLEALLTPTLVELLPDEVDDQSGSKDGAEKTAEEEVEEEEEEKYTPVKSRPLPTPVHAAPGKKRQHAPSSSGKPSKRAAPPPVVEDEEGEVDFVEEAEEMEEQQRPPPPPPVKKKGHPPAKKGGKHHSSGGSSSRKQAIDDAFPDEENLAYELGAEEEVEREERAAAAPVSGKRTAPAAAVHRKSTSPPPSYEDEDVDESYEREEMVEEDEEPAPPRASTTKPRHAATGRAAIPQSRRQPSPPPPQPIEDEEVEYEEVEVEEEEEIEEPIPPAPRTRRAATITPTPTATSRRQTDTATARPLISRRREVPMDDEDDVDVGAVDGDAYETVVEEAEVVPPPKTVQRSGAPRHAAPAAGKKMKTATMTASKLRKPQPPHAEEPAAGEGSEEDWFSAAKNRPKRRYFS